jgi:hypothetical protein
MKLEVGMYVRYEYEKNVYIGKIKFISEVMCGLDETLQINIDNCIEEILKRDIVKASHNIIDLIEVGDYVNGCYVSNRRASVNEHLGGHPKGIGIIKCKAYFNQGNYNDCKFEWIEEKDIKSIVTKEQFKSIKYSLEG